MPASVRTGAERHFYRDIPAFKRDGDFFLTVSYDKPHGPSLCPAPYNTMYEGFTFDDQPNFADDLSKKPFMQQLWAGDDLHKTAAEINHPSKALALFLGCNTFVDYEIGKVIDKINELMPGRGEGKSCRCTGFQH